MTRADILREVATLSRAGVPLHDGLARLAPTLPTPWKGRAQGWSERLRQGHPLSHSMADVPPGLASGDHALLEAAEHSGRLDQCLDELATASEIAERRHGRLQTAAIYPVLLLHGAAIIPAFLTWSQQGPAAALLQIGLILLPCYALATVTAIGISGRARRPAPGALDAFIDLIPLLGPGLRLAATARLCRVLAGLLEAGVRVEDALLRAAAACGHPGLRASLTTQASRVAGGASLTDMLQATRRIDDTTLGILHSGELAGTPTESLRRAAERCEAAAMRKLDRAAILAPMACYFLAVGVALLQILRMLAPLFNIYRQVLE